MNKEEFNETWNDFFTTLVSYDKEQMERCLKAFCDDENCFDLIPSPGEYDFFFKYVRKAVEFDFNFYHYYIQLTGKAKEENEEVFTQCDEADKLAEFIEKHILELKSINNDWTFEDSIIKKYANNDNKQKFIVSQKLFIDENYLDAKKYVDSQKDFYYGKTLIYPSFFTDIGNPKFLEEVIKKSQSAQESNEELNDIVNLNSGCVIKELKVCDIKEDNTKLDILKKILRREIICESDIGNYIAKMVGDEFLTVDDVGFLLDVKIVFSYEEKRMHYKGLTKNEIVKIIEDFLNSLGKQRFSLPTDVQDKIEKIEEIKHKIEMNNIDEVEYLISRLLGDNGRICQDDEWNKKLKDVVQKLQQREHDVFTLGEFSKEDNQITLYIKNIYNLTTNKENLLKKLMSVYAHELVHAYHSMHSSTWPNTDEAKIVKESLADYVQSEYDAKIGLSNNRYYATWRSNDMHNYPYAGAKYLKFGLGYIFEKNALCKKVYRTSLTNFDKAYDLLKFFYNME